MALNEADPKAPRSDAAEIWLGSVKDVAQIGKYLPELLQDYGLLAAASPLLLVAPAGITAHENC